MKEKNKKRVSTVVVASMLLVLLASVITPVGADDNGDPMVAEDSDSYTIRNPIRIEGNSDFVTQAAAEGWSGDGSENNPYVIEGYEINGTGYGYGIYIGNTTLYLVVTNCYVHNISGILNYPYRLNDGIHFYTVQNGNVFSNIISNCEGGGIRFTETENSIISDNYITNNYRGVSLGRSHNNVITHNTIHRDTHSPQTGIGLLYSNGNIINNNTISKYRYGIFEDTCKRNVIENNAFMDVETEYDYAYEVENGNTGNSDTPFMSFAFSTVAILTAVCLTWKKRRCKGDGSNP